MKLKNILLFALLLGSATVVQQAYSGDPDAAAWANADPGDYAVGGDNDGGDTMSQEEYEDRYGSDGFFGSLSRTAEQRINRVRDKINGTFNIKQPSVVTGGSDGVSAIGSDGISADDQESAAQGSSARGLRDMTVEEYHENYGKDGWLNSLFRTKEQKAARERDSQSKQFGKTQSLLVDTEKYYVGSYNNLSDYSAKQLDTLANYNRQRLKNNREPALNNPGVRSGLERDVGIVEEMARTKRVQEAYENAVKRGMDPRSRAEQILNAMSDPNDPDTMDQFVTNKSDNESLSYIKGSVNGDQTSADDILAEFGRNRKSITPETLETPEDIISNAENVLSENIEVLNTQEKIVEAQDRTVDAILKLESIGESGTPLHKELEDREEELGEKLREEYPLRRRLSPQEEQSSRLMEQAQEKIKFKKGKDGIKRSNAFYGGEREKSGLQGVESGTSAEVTQLRQFPLDGRLKVEFSDGTFKYLNPENVDSFLKNVKLGDGDSSALSKEERLKNRGSGLSRAKRNNRGVNPNDVQVGKYGAEGKDSVFASPKDLLGENDSGLREIQSALKRLPSADRAREILNENLPKKRLDRRNAQRENEREAQRIRAQMFMKSLEVDPNERVDEEDNIASQNDLFTSPDDEQRAMEEYGT